MMTVYAISDLHGHLPHIPECDLLVLGGDYAPGRDPELQTIWFLNTFKRWLESVPARYIVGIAGNHDFALEMYPNMAKQLPWIYLCDSGVDIEGITIYGTPWAPKFGRWAFMKEDDNLADAYAKIPEGLDILVSHSPVYGVLDRSVSGDICGSRQLRERVKDVCPDSFICGHIHEAHGIQDDGATRYYNVAHVNVEIEPKNLPQYIPLRGGE